MTSKDPKRFKFILLTIFGLFLFTIVFVWLITKSIIRSELEYGSDKQKETRRIIDSIMEKRHSHVPLPPTLSADLRLKEDDLWISAVPVTDDDIKLLAQRTQIRRLRVPSDLSIDGLAVLQKEPLVDLELRKQVLNAEFLKALSKIRTVRRLSLRKATDLDSCFHSLNGPVTLRKLSLSQTNISEQCLVHICNSFPNLTYLNLGDCQSLTVLGLSSLSKLHKLSTLILERVPLSGQPLKIICRAIDHPLSYLSLSECGITDKDVDAITSMSIESITLDFNPITDASLISLDKLKNLRTISLIGCRYLTKRGLERYARRNPKHELILSRERHQSQLLKILGDID